MKIDSRANDMLRMYTVEANTLQEIGNVYGITRERVRQILAKVSGETLLGGASLRSMFTRIHKEKSVKAESKCFDFYGCSLETRNKYGKVTDTSSLTHKFRQQKNNSARRGIEFLFTLPEWIEVWEKSGHLEDRGFGGGKYCMSRICDLGPYSIDNVEIKRHEENSSDARQMDFVRGRWQPNELKVLADKAGLKYRTVHARVHVLGWPIEKAVNTPLMKSKWDIPPLIF
jgi:hypothetical protein